MLGDKSMRLTDKRFHKPLGIWSEHADSASQPPTPTTASLSSGRSRFELRKKDVTFDSTWTASRSESAVVRPAVSQAVG